MAAAAPRAPVAPGPRPAAGCPAARAARPRRPPARCRPLHTGARQARGLAAGVSWPGQCRAAALRSRGPSCASSPDVPPLPSGRLRTTPSHARTRIVKAEEQAQDGGLACGRVSGRESWVGAQASQPGLPAPCHCPRERWPAPGPQGPPNHSRCHSAASPAQLSPAARSGQQRGAAAAGRRTGARGAHQGARSAGGHPEGHALHAGEQGRAGRGSAWVEAGLCQGRCCSRPRTRLHMHRCSPAHACNAP